MDQDQPIGTTAAECTRCGDALIPGVTALPQAPPAGGSAARRAPLPGSAAAAETRSSRATTSLWPWRTPRTCARTAHRRT